MYTREEGIIKMPQSKQQKREGSVKRLQETLKSYTYKSDDDPETILFNQTKQKNLNRMIEQTELAIKHGRSSY